MLHPYGSCWGERRWLESWGLRSELAIVIKNYRHTEVWGMSAFLVYTNKYTRVSIRSQQHRHNLICFSYMLLLLGRLPHIYILLQTVEVFGTKSHKNLEKPHAYIINYYEFFYFVWNRCESWQTLIRQDYVSRTVILQYCLHKRQMGWDNPKGTFINKKVVWDFIKNIESIIVFIGRVFMKIHSSSGKKSCLYKQPHELFLKKWDNA